MQVHTDSKVPSFSGSHGPVVKALHHVFGTSPKIRIHGVYTYVYMGCIRTYTRSLYVCIHGCIHTYTPHVYTPCALDSNVLNPKSIAFSRLLRTTTMPSFKSFRLGFSFYRANIQTHTHCDKSDHNIRAAMLHR